MTGKNISTHRSLYVGGGGGGGGLCLVMKGKVTKLKLIKKLTSKEHDRA